MTVVIGHLRAAEAEIRAMHPHDAARAYSGLLVELAALVEAAHHVTWAVDGASEALADLRRAIVRARARTTRTGGVGRLGEGGKGGG